MKDSDVDVLYTTFGAEGGLVSPGEVLEQILESIQRIEHVVALDMVMRHGTPEQARRAREHMRTELARQEHDNGLG